MAASAFLVVDILGISKTGNSMINATDSKNGKTNFRLSFN
jgi:hypothetical protein